MKTHQLNLKKKLFEKLPQFFKAGVYYTKKLLNTRKQRFFQKIIVHELLKKEGSAYFTAGEYDRALHRYEEALSLWRYYICHNPKWEEEGIDDDEIELFEDVGNTDSQKRQIRELKLTSYLNIAVCNLKVKDFVNALAACEEALHLNPASVKAYYL